MGGAPVVIVLVGLVVPILLLLAALIFDVGIIAWSVYHGWHEHWAPRLARIGNALAHPVRHAPRTGTR